MSWPHITAEGIENLLKTISDFFVFTKIVQREHFDLRSCFTSAHAYTLQIVTAKLGLDWDGQTGRARGVFLYIP